MKSQATSFVLIVVVIAIVAGVAWYRSTPPTAPEPTNPPSSANPAASLNTDAAPGASRTIEPTVESAAAPVKEGELCPEPPPTMPADDSPAPVTTAPAAAQKLPRMVDLGADKCIPCKKLAPILEELKKEYEGRVVVEFIDVWKNPQAGDPYKIKLIPTQVFFDAEGKEVWRHEGFLPKEAFIAKFKELGVN